MISQNLLLLLFLVLFGKLFVFAVELGKTVAEDRLHVAVMRGTDVDQPRNLAKSVTVE